MHSWGRPCALNIGLRKGLLLNITILNLNSLDLLKEYVDDGNEIAMNEHAQLTAAEADTALQLQAHGNTIIERKRAVMKKRREFEEQKLRDLEELEDDDYDDDDDEFDDTLLGEIDDHDASLKEAEKSLAKLELGENEKDTNNSDQQAGPSSKPAIAETAADETSAKGSRPKTC